MTKRNVLAVIIGNAMEWYDFIIYASMATIIASVFFPKEDTFSALLATFGIFAIAYLARPLGGFLIGHIGDKHGRRMALIVSVFLMAIPSVSIGLIPSYQTIGRWAPALLIILRIMQGFAVGGEYPASMIYLVETAPATRRGFIGSFAMAGIIVGIMLGTSVTLLVNYLLTPTQLYAWGWRIPFLLGVFLIGIGFYLRLRLQDTSTYLALKQQNKLANQPLLEALKQHKTDIIKTVLLLVFNSVAFYSITIFLVTYLTKQARLPFNLTDALSISLISSGALFFFILLSGLLSDFINRLRVLQIATVAAIVLSYPLYWMFNQGNYLTALLAQLIFVAILALYIGPLPATLARQFNSQLRVSSVAISYNVALALFGGSAPTIALLLIHYFHSNMAPSYYLIISAIISLLTLLTMRSSRAH
ncbi:MHS family MFS transporter [soil metagenome]